MSYPNERTCLTLAQLNNSLVPCNHGNYNGNNLGYIQEHSVSNSQVNNRVLPSNVGFFINEKKFIR